jgi:septum formation protein
LPLNDGNQIGGGPVGSVVRVLGKPRNRNDAANILAALAGKVHRVYTGLALLDRTLTRIETILSTSSVKIAALSAKEMSAYLDSGEWVGAAGAYRIQGKGASLIERIEGSWSGIVGLPIRELYVILNRFGLSAPFERMDEIRYDLGKRTPRV